MSLLSYYTLLVPNGLLPAIKLDNKMQTDSLPIMLNLDRTFTGSTHKPMFPSSTTNSIEYIRAERLMKLERTLFSSWCNLVFRSGVTAADVRGFERDMDEVDKELAVTASPW